MRPLSASTTYYFQNTIWHKLLSHLDKKWDNATIEKKKITVGEVGTFIPFTKCHLHRSKIRYLEINLTQTVTSDPKCLLIIFLNVIKAALCFLLYINPLIPWLWDLLEQFLEMISWRCDPVRRGVFILHCFLACKCSQTSGSCSDRKDVSLKM